MFGDCDYGLCLNYNDVSHVKSAGKPKKILEIKLGKFWRCRAILKINKRIHCVGWGIYFFDVLFDHNHETAKAKKINKLYVQFLMSVVTAHCK